MSKVRPIFQSYRPPVPSEDATDADVLAYADAWQQWANDRALAGYADRITVAESEAGHAEALTRAAALSV